jgi:ribosomal-protein-alanine N-acetyltransferase
MEEKTIPRLATRRLVLRPFRRSDAPEVRRLAGAREVADTTLRIPHPYPEGAAEAWIETHAEDFSRGHAAVFCIERRRPRAVVGAIELDIEPAHARAELGYWIGKAFWGEGYATEAALEALRFGFEDLGLERIEAHHFLRNPASGRVMQKIGMVREGRLRRHVRKGDAFEDLEIYGILREELARGAGSGEDRPRGAAGGATHSKKRKR